MSNDLLGSLEFTDGTITAEMVSVGGALTPEAADDFISLVVDQTKFKQFSVERMSKLKKDLQALDIANRVLLRIPQGQEPTTAQLAGLINTPKTLYALENDLFYRLTFDTLRDNKDKPDFENRLAAMFAAKVGNELEDLAFNGVDDDGSEFVKLNEGWVFLAKAAADNTSREVNVASWGSNIVTNLKKLITAQDKRFRAQSAFIMAAAVYDDLIVELSSKPGGLNFLLQGEIPRFMGKPIVMSDYMPEDVVLFTPPANLVVGMNTNIERYREVSGTKRCIDYTITLATDFLLRIDAALAIGYAL